MDEPDLGVLATLDALLQEVSVTRAARRVGLSTAAMSHALARLRETLGDPLLVRAGREMVLTPRAAALRERVHDVVTEARTALAPVRPFVPAELSRTFSLIASDYVLSVVGLVADRLLRAEAPGVGLRYLPNAHDDATRLRDGGADLAVGIYADLPPEMRSRQLLTDRFVCVVRAGHPVLGKRFTLERFLAQDHLQIAPRGRPGGYLDDTLEARGLSRRVARAVPFFLPALHLVSQTDYVLTVSERVARQLADTFGLVVLEPPIKLDPYALSLVWHPRFDGDAEHRYLREVLTRAAAEAARGRHDGARTQLVPTRRRSGKAKR